MRIAIIDCGTNTFHLMIVETHNNKISGKIFTTKATVKLGEDGITKQYISQAPFERGILALQIFSKWITHYKAEKVVAYATAAIRNASNGADFMNTVKESAGITLDLISGNREAELIYRGVKQALELGDATSMIMDIGGGSTEFVICNNEKIFWRMSFPLGAALLLEKFPPSDPIMPNEIQQINHCLYETLSPLFTACTTFHPTVLVGSSGSFESFAEMIGYQKPNKKSRGDTSYDFIMNDYHDIHSLLMKSTTKERVNMKGLVKMRVDMIVLSSLLLTFVLSETGIVKIKLSTYALKEGMLAELSDGLG